MTTSLSPEILRAMEEAGEQPLEIIDPETRQHYMLMKGDVFDRLRIVLQGSRLSEEEQRFLLRQAGLRAGWDDPGMDIYDDLAASPASATR